MSVVRKFAVVLLLGGILLQVPAPTADGAVLSTCIRILMNYVGKPVLKGAATTAGGLVANHFAAKLAGAQEAKITETDVQQLARQAQQQGMSDCELRAQVEQLVSASTIEPNRREPIPRGSYSAIARCSLTGAVGRSSDEDTPREALEAAVEDCIDRGGVPGCCVEGARLVR